MKRIICIGNPHVECDGGGSAVYERLVREALPEDVELLDGGLRGIDLLGLVESSERVAFVDAVSGWGGPGKVVVLEKEDLLEAAACRYEHAAGFAYLLRALPHLLKDPVPLCVIGLELPAGPAAIEEAAALALDFACPVRPAPGRIAECLPQVEGR